MGIHRLDDDGGMKVPGSAAGTRIAGRRLAEGPG